MATVVEYILNLKENLSQGVENANTHVNKLESSLGGVRSMMESVGGMLATLGVGFAIFKGAEFVHEGVEAFHALEQVTAKVEANLESTGEKAGLNMTDITDMAKRLSSQVQFSRADVMDMQSQLLTFPSITKDVFEQSMGMVTDIAKQTNHGLSETAIMFGKAFNDPADGLQKLMRYGVMFSDAEKDKITKLQESGHLLEAQKSMLDAIAGSGYEGVAKKMFDADPLAQYNKMMGSVKLQLGEWAMELLKTLMPALNEFAEIMKSSIKFLGEHKDTIAAVALGIGVAAAAWGIYTVVVNASTWATQLWAGAQAILNVILTANPIGIVIVAIGVLVAAVKIAWDNCVGFRAVVTGLWGTLKEFGSIVGDIFGGLWKQIHGVFTFSPSEIKDGMGQMVGAMADAGQRMASAYKQGYDGVINADNLAKAEAAGLKAPGLVAAPKKAGGSNNAGEKAPKQPATKATGNKSVTINIRIDKLGETHLNVTNLKEGMAKIRDIVVSTLAGAVNDFQVVAAQ